jgi:hypothetical protein
MNTVYSESKTDLKLQCDYCIKFQLFKGAQNVIGRWWLCVACCCPKTHTDYPSTTRGASVGPPIVVNINFCGYLWFFSISFVQYRMPPTTYQVKKWPVLIFQLTVNCRESDKQRQAVSRTALFIQKLRSCYVLTYKSGFLERFRRWRRSILVTQRNHDLHLSCSLPKHCGNSDRNEKNSSKLRHTVCDILVSHLAI